jgi:hypothetical protein
MCCGIRRSYAYASLNLIYTPSHADPHQLLSTLHPVQKHLRQESGQADLLHAAKLETCPGHTIRKCCIQGDAMLLDLAGFALCAGMT